MMKFKSCVFQDQQDDAKNSENAQTLGSLGEWTNTKIKKINISSRMV